MTAAALAGLVAFLRTEQGATLGAWQERTRMLPPGRGLPLLAYGAHLLDWLADALVVDHDAASPPPPPDTSFSAPRAIAELTLLADTIARARPSSGSDVHLVIDTAIAASIARDRDEAVRAQTRLRLASHLTLVGSWELDVATGSVSMDRRSRELFGVDEGQPSTIDALTSELQNDDRDAVRDGIARTADSSVPYSGECRRGGPVGGSVRWLAVAAEAHVGPAPKALIVLGIVHDISATKRSEEDHARVVQELARAVQISEMFVGILSRDLKTPLGPLLLASSGDRIGHLIDQLVDFSRARLGEGIRLERAAVDLSIVARAASAQATPNTLHFTTTGDTSGKWDEARLRQVLASLVENAVVHGELGGAVEVLINGTDAELVTVTIENAGVIPGHVLPTIFHPFRGGLEKDARSTGLGLGLYVARQIALAHGGDLSVESAAGKTAFLLALPRDQGDAAPSRQDVVREEELAAFERLAAPSRSSAVTAQLYGAAPLSTRSPHEHSDIVERYRGLLGTALQRRAYRGHGEELADDLRALADRLGQLEAGPREVTDVHARALRLEVRGASAAKTQALLAEGRLLALELMGNLASYYRRRSRGATRIEGALGTNA